MEQGVTLEHMILLSGFAVVVAVAAWHRTGVDAAIAALPEAARDRLEWFHLGDKSSARRHRREVASRLVLRGLPPWVPLTAQGWRHLMWLRAFALAAMLFVVVVPALLTGDWILMPIIGVPSALAIAVRAWQVGPWGGEA